MTERGGMDGWKPLGTLITLLAAVSMAGCATMQQDIAALGDNLFAPSPAEAARWMVDPYNSDNRRRGTLLISNAPFGGADVYVRQYRDMARNEADPITRAAAVRALGRHGSVEDAPLIASQLAHENQQVRWEAARGLQRIHNPTVIPLLLRALRRSEENADIHVAVAIALGQYPTDRVFQSLVTSLDARQLAINAAAANSLTVLTGQSFGTNANRWLDWYNARLDANADPFADGQEFMFPTYTRKLSWLDHVTFWSKPVFEHPAPPAGLRPVAQSGTYAEEDAAEASGEAPDEAGG
jgi:hypothetical protein